MDFQEKDEAATFGVPRINGERLPPRGWTRATKEGSCREEGPTL
jgi:hypothetical protein